jgi:hypothetical protein
MVINPHDVDVLTNHVNALATPITHHGYDLPAEVRRREVAELGLGREDGVLERRVRPDPSHGGSTGYDVHDRLSQLAAASRGEPVRASRASLYRWMIRPIALLATGNSASTEFTGEHQLLLVFYLIGRPKASLDELRAFIANESEDHVVFQRPTISKVLKRLSLTRKRGSTIAKQAFTPLNMLKTRLFWTTSWPTGIFRVPRCLLLDSDECGINLCLATKKLGHAVKGARVVQKGNYSPETKITVILTIEPGDPNLPPEALGSVENPRRWVRVSNDVGTDAATYSEHIQRVLNDFGPNEPRRYFMHDNLASHNDCVQTVMDAGHRVVNRPPWRPIYGPTEYKFNDLECQIRQRADYIHTMADLIEAIYNIFTNMRGFDSTFAHIGYAADGNHSPNF